MSSKATTSSGANSWQDFWRGYVYRSGFDIAKTLKGLAIFWIFMYAMSQPIKRPPEFTEDCEFWVAPKPQGDDNNSGSYESPWATMEHANMNVPDANCVVWMREGEYLGESHLDRRFETQTTFKSIQPYKAVLMNNGLVVRISGAKNITLDGFDIAHSGPGASVLVIAIDGNDDGWSEYVTLRDNIIHDSYNNDLLKIYNLSRFITVENNIFYNQGPGEEHLDINSVTDVVIQDNIFFNAYEESGRPNQNDSKQFIVIKDSNGDSDGLIGSQRVTVRRNILLNWQGQSDETLIQVGLDGKPYFEAVDVHIENNLLIGNSINSVIAAFGIRGAKDVYFTNNTIVGDLPSSAYAFRITIAGQNPVNQNIYFYNNIWSDYTGTMGEDMNGGTGEFSDGDPVDTDNLVLDNNLYWNAGALIPVGELVSPIPDDARRVIANPHLNSDHSFLLLPYWDGSAFLSGADSVRDEFFRLVNTYGALGVFSPAKDKADPTHAPLDDILGWPRWQLPDMGSYEHRFNFMLLLPYIIR